MKSPDICTTTLPFNGATVISEFHPTDSKGDSIMKTKVISILTTLFTLLLPVAAFSQVSGGGIDQKVGEIFSTVFGPFVSFIFYSVTINGVSFPLDRCVVDHLCGHFDPIYGVCSIHGCPTFY